MEGAKTFYLFMLMLIVKVYQSASVIEVSEVASSSSSRYKYLNELMVFIQRDLQYSVELNPQPF